MKGRVNRSFLCPVNIDSMNLQGDIGAEHFQYIKLGIKACVDRPDCKARDDISDVSTNLVMLKA